MILPILLALTIISCSNKEELKKLDNNHPKVIYIEEHSKGSDVTAGDFGDVVVMDLKTREVVKITDDSYVDRSPCFSPDGKYIAFLTSRAGSRKSRMIQGIGAPHQLCIYDIKTQKYRVIDINRKFSKILGFNKFHNLQFSPDSRSLYFSDVSPYIYKYKISEDSLSIVHILPDSMDVNKIMFLPGKENLVIYSVSNSYFVCVLSMFDKNDKHDRDIIVPGEYLDTGRWTDKGKLILFSQKNEIFQYDLTSNSKTEMTYKKGQLEFPYRELYYLNNSLIGFGTTPPYSDREEVVRYDIKKGSFEKLTDNNKYKTDLEIYPNKFDR